MKPFRPARRPQSTRRSTILRATVTVFLVMLAGVAVAAPAQAVAYRSWGYFHLEKGAWAFAQTGPAQAVPKDGAVEGWRYAVADVSPVRAPRATPTFDALCAAVRVAAGTKRVGLVIDYGRPADTAEGSTPPAPRAICVAVPQKATGSDVLVAAGATLRLDKSFVCAIDGLPAAGCGEKVDPVPAAAASPDTSVTMAAPTPSASATPLAKSGDMSADSDSTSSRWPVVGGVGAIVVVAGLGFAAWRRNRDAADD